jgi:DNA-directed RNA polymerase specialized sigma24 family protein
MDNDVSFADLLLRARGGDAAAAAELVRRHEPSVRRAVRLRLTDPQLQRAFDSTDICQSILGNFFVRLYAGEFELDCPGQLVNLLITMALNKLRDYARREYAGKRRPPDRPTPAGDGGQDVALVADRQDSPSAIVAVKELLERVRALLSKEERYILDQRRLGRDWAELAAEAGTTPDALRMKYKRALDRVCRQLGLAEVPHE